MLRKGKRRLTTGAGVNGSRETAKALRLLLVSERLVVFQPSEGLFVSLQVQPNSYYTFYDDHMQNWSIIFESEKSSSDFCKEVSARRGPLLRWDSKLTSLLCAAVVPSLASRCVWPKPTAPPA